MATVFSFPAGHLEPHQVKEVPLPFRSGDRAENRADERGAAGRAATGGPSLSQKSNNSIIESVDTLNILTGGHRRMAYVLDVELVALVEKYGLKNCGFMTLTVGDKNPPSIASVQKRFNSLRTNELCHRYEKGIWVVQRGDENNRVHMHGVVALEKDIWTAASGDGPVDFQAFKRRDYRTAGPYLRSEWRWLRSTLPSYGFGRTELLPIMTTAEGIAQYVGSYIGKHVGCRIAEDKGKRLIRFMNYRVGDRKASSRLAWANERSWIWRQKLGAWAMRFGMASMDEIKAEYGPRWAYTFQEDILGMTLPVGTMYPSMAAAVASGEQHQAREQKRATALLSVDDTRCTRTVLQDGTRTCQPETPVQEKARLLRESMEELQGKVLQEVHCFANMPF